MLKFAAAALAAAFLMMPTAGSAQTVPAETTDISAQSVRVGPDGVRVRVGHGRWESRRRAHRRGDRCRTVRITERRPSGRVITKTVRRCS